MLKRQDTPSGTSTKSPSKSQRVMPAQIDIPCLAKREKFGMLLCLNGFCCQSDYRFQFSLE